MCPSEPPGFAASGIVLRAGQRHTYTQYPGIPPLENSTYTAEAEALTHGFSRGKRANKCQTNHQRQARDTG